MSECRELGHPGTRAAEPVCMETEPCPRCGCHASVDFCCGCGAVHDRYCNNCHRWRSLPVADHTTLAAFDVRCDLGSVPHEHPAAEHTARVSAWLQRAFRPVPRRHRSGS